jgi:hypothetical protein
MVNDYSHLGLMSTYRRAVEGIRGLDRVMHGGVILGVAKTVLVETAALGVPDLLGLRKSARQALPALLADALVVG